jgi:hypothetical protein
VQQLMQHLLSVPWLQPASGDSLGCKAGQKQHAKLKSQLHAGWQQYRPTVQQVRTAANHSSSEASPPRVQQMLTGCGQPIYGSLSSNAPAAVYGIAKGSAVARACMLPLHVLQVLMIPCVLRLQPPKGNHCNIYTL